MVAYFALQRTLEVIQYKLKIAPFRASFCRDIAMIMQKATWNNIHALYVYNHMYHQHLEGVRSTHIQMVRTQLVSAKARNEIFD